jgi:hypothetical protein
MTQALGMDSMGHQMIPVGRCRVDCHLHGGVCTCAHDAPHGCGSHACECKPDFFGLDCATETRHGARSGAPRVLVDMCQGTGHTRLLSAAHVWSGAWAAKEYLPPADAASVEQLRRKWHSGAWHHLMNELENLQSSRCNECVAFATHTAWPI